MRGTWLILTVLTISGNVARADWWYTYEASEGTFPEQQGWQRNTDAGGAQRWFEDGAFVLDASADPTIIECYTGGMGSLPDPNDPTHVFVCDCRLEVASMSGWWDPTLFVNFQGYGEVVLGFKTDCIYSLHEYKYIAYFQPGVFHSFRLATTDMDFYTLAVDGVVVYAGDVSTWPAWHSDVQFGDAGPADAGASRWDYVRYGVFSALVGDANCDATVDFSDINPFIGVLTAPADMPGCGVMNADINQDGAVDFADINPFVDLMLQVH